MSSQASSGEGRPLPRIHIVGKKNSGKTTLVCELVQELNRRGFRVATVKHTHHQHELDTPGKDSFQHRTAGAFGVGILSPAMTALFLPIDREQTVCNRESRYRAFEVLFADCHLILVEGDLQTTAPRMEVWRAAVTEQPYAAEDSLIVAVVTDDELRCPATRISRLRIDLIADFLLKTAGLS